MNKNSSYISIIFCSNEITTTNGSLVIYPYPIHFTHIPQYSNFNAIRSMCSHLIVPVPLTNQDTPIVYFTQSLSLGSVSIPQALRSILLNLYKPIFILLHCHIAPYSSSHSTTESARIYIHILTSLNDFHHDL